MIIYLWGEDSFLRNKKLKEILNLYKDKYQNFDLLILDIEEEVVKDIFLKIKDFLNQPSMFILKKVLVLKQFFLLEDSQENKEIKNFLEKFISDENIFIIISDERKAKKIFLNLLEKAYKVYSFNELTGENLKKFILKELKLRSLVFSKKAFDYFLNYILSFPNRSNLVINELDKIYFLKLKKTIELEDLKKIIFWQSKEEVNIINKKLANSYSLKEKLFYLEKMFLQKEEPAYIFNNLVYYLKNEKIFKLADYDVLIKSGELTYEEALLDFILN